MAFAVLPALRGFAGGVAAPALTVSGTMEGSRLVSINWNNVKQPERYRWGLYRFDMEEKTYTFVTELESLQSSYLDENLNPPVSKYFYKVEIADKNASFTNSRPIRIKREEVLKQLTASAAIDGAAMTLGAAPPPDVRSAVSGRMPAWYSAGNEGIYVGIISFSGKVTDITQRPDGSPVLVPLDAPGRQVLLEYLDRSYALSKSNGTALYYANHKAIANLTAMEKEGALPSNLDSVSLITFTDGTDTSSTDVEFTPIEGKDFRHGGTGTGYRTYISQQLATRRIAGVKINAWAIGIRGKDVEGNAEFPLTLEAVASGPDNVAEFSFISQLDNELGTIANGLNIYTPRTNLTFSTPAYPVNTQVRLTFDGDTAYPDASEYYVDARVGWDAGNKSYYLTVLDSSGITLSGGRRLDGKRNETGIYYTLAINNDFSEAGVRQWYIQPGDGTAGWIRNSESETEKAVDFTHERKSAVVYLVLDCSASLTEKEIHDVRAAMAAFINKLYDISSSKIELAAVGNYYLQRKPPETETAKLERPVQPSTGRQQQNVPAVPPASQRPYGQGAYVPQTGSMPQAASVPPARHPPAVRFTRQETSQSPAVSLPSASSAVQTSRSSQPAYKDPAPAQGGSGAGSTPSMSAQTFYWVQAGSYTDAARAHRAWSAFGKAGLGRAEIFSSNIDGTIYYRVKAGPYADRAAAEDALARMKSYSADYRNSFIANE
jgi:cell division protein FtsN